MRTHAALSLTLFLLLPTGCTIQQKDANAGAGGSGPAAGASGSPSAGGSSSAGSSGDAGASAAGASAGDAGAAGQGGSAGGQGGGGSTSQGGSSQAGSAGASAGSAQAGSGGSAQAGSGGSAQAGSAGSPQAGSAGSAQAGSGGSAQAGSGGEGGQGGEGQAGSGAGGGQGGSGAGGSAGSAGGAIVSCTQATVFSGSPTFTGDPVGQNPKGHPVKAEPPLRFRDIAFNGDTLGVSTQLELWSLDMTAPNPVYVKIAGTDGDNGYQPGPCAGSLFGNITGLAPLPGGDWIAADYVGNALLRVSGAGKSDCQVAVLAGNAEAFSGSEILPKKPGDVDGPGSKARFDGPMDVVTDAAGNAYFIDHNNAKVKKMASDEAHTVTTLANLGASPLLDAAAFNAATLLGGHVYLAGLRSTGEDLVIRVAVDTGEISIVFDEFGGLEGVSSTLANFNAMDNDGTALLVAGAAGHVWRIPTEGKPTLPLSPIAGGGRVLGLEPEDYDFTKPFPALEAPMSCQSTVFDTMAIYKGSIYWPSVANGTGYWLYKYDCP